jgi:glycosyltransferase involved in cell wall biosynthesis
MTRTKPRSQPDRQYQNSGSPRAGSKTLTIVHPTDPWDQGLGGFDTCLDGILRYAPDPWQIEFVGLSTDPLARPPGNWIEHEFGNRRIRFFAVLGDPEPDTVRPIPLSLRFAIASRIRRVKPTGALVQFHRFESALAVPLKPGQAAVHFLHNHPEEVDSIHSDVRWRRWGWLFRRLLKWKLSEAAGIVAVDPRTPGWIASNMPRLSDRILWLTQWADPATFHLVSAGERASAATRLKEQLALPPGTSLIGFVGRLERQKDPFLILNSVAAVGSQKLDVALVVIGKGRLESELAIRSHSLGLASRVRFVQPVQRRQLADMYRAFDVVACSSGFEAGPRVVFEALACGTPVVSFDVGQVSEVLGGDRPAGVGELVRERSAAAFAEALVRVLGQPQTEARANSCAGAVKDHTPAVALGGLFELYEDSLRRWSRQ